MSKIKSPWIIELKASFQEDDYLYLKNCHLNGKKEENFRTVKEMKCVYGNCDNDIQNIFKEAIEIKPPFPDHNLLFASVEIPENNH